MFTASPTQAAPVPTESSCNPASSDSPHPAPQSPMLCCYHNTSGQLQIIRLVSPAPPQLEKIVFPGDRLLFHALPDVQIDVYSRNPPDSAARSVTQVVDRLPCAALRVSVPEA